MKTRIIGQAIAVVTPKGLLSDMDDGNLNLLEAELKRLVASGIVRIIVDMHEVSHINSGGLGPLIVAHSSCASRGGRFALAGLNASIVHLLEITKLQKIFEVFATVDDAVAAEKTSG